MRRKSINTTPMSELIIGKLNEKGMTQAELARHTGISEVTINDLIANRRQFSPKQIIAISLILGLDAIEFGRKQSDYRIMQEMRPYFNKEEDKQ